MDTDHWPADAVAAVTHPDPYPYYTALAVDPAPRYDERLRLWVAAHPGTVRELLANPDCRVRPVHEPVPAALAGPAGDLFGALVRMNDGARHAAPKAVLQRALAALPEEAAADVAAAVAANMVADQAADKAADTAAALNAFVHGVPVQTVAALLGFTDGELPRVAALVARYVACLSPLASASDIVAAHEAEAALVDALRRLVRDGRQTALLASVAAAPWPDEHAMLANLAGLMTQTFEATAGLLGNCIVARLRGDASDPAVLAPAVMARDPAIHNTRRFAAGDLRIDGAHVPAGQALLLVLAGAAPFGDGRHACPGQALARIIATQALHALPASGPQAAGPVPGVTWRYRPSVNARMPVFIGESKR
ncbi:cytochrome P450 [Pseudoduganella umbonata]|uniref:Cytochrome P450 n=1 Tax=Pseudoduganella umbonata TaxID=864828 RepID=A0A4P8HTX9_9BURK|nr:cytochrome P450 [Pseudoduganella umbonata]MBB3224658.1 cytochrome P450 [Pseudoduganella umbonata]QCP13413.1 cytochrome P450 [Pseudoduganella umbonata]